MEGKLLPIKAFSLDIYENVILVTDYYPHDIMRFFTICYV